MSHSSSRCDPPDDSPTIPSRFALTRAYPNPFNPTLTVLIALPVPATLSLRLFNVIGQQVATLADGPYPPGQQRFTLDAHPLPTGLYFLHATVPGEMHAVQEVVLMKRVIRVIFDFWEIFNLFCKH